MEVLFHYFKDNVQAKTRLYRIYCVNVTSEISIKFKFLTMFFSNMLYSRIKLTDKPIHPELLTHCNPG
jgi:hypothetical protein